MDFWESWPSSPDCWSLPSHLPNQPLPPDNAAIVDRLQQQEKIDEFKARYWSQEPLTQRDYYVQEKEDRVLIAKISADEPVSQDDLAQALKQVETDY